MLLIPEKIIFVHIPKTGGSSVEEFIMSQYGYKRNECLLVHGFSIDLNAGEGHYVPYPIMHFKLKTILRIAEANKAQIDNSWTIFSIVRNPYYKFLSELFFQDYTNLKYNYHMLPDNVKSMYLDSCVDEYFNHKASENYHSYHSLEQYKFFENTNVNYQIFKFEDGLENIVKKLGFKVKNQFPHLLDVSVYADVPKPNYSKMLTPYLVETINTRYKKDFEVFGYEMLDPAILT
jgi:hypothetical protein